jgi:hypothetical protein
VGSYAQPHTQTLSSHVLRGEGEVRRARRHVYGGNIIRKLPGHELPGAEVEILGCDDDDSQWKLLPPLSCGPVEHAAAFAIDESESELGQVLLIGYASREFGA